MNTLTTTAFTEVVKYGTNQIIDYTTDHDNARPQISDNMISLFYPIDNVGVKSIVLSMTNQSPLINHGYALFNGSSSIAVSDFTQ